VTKDALTANDYLLLADFRSTLRRFLAFSEARAAEVGLTPQQHQALLAIKAAEPARATVGHVADRLLLKPHSATGLINRLEALGLVERRASAQDRRLACVALTPEADRLLALLSVPHREEIRRLRPLLDDLLARISA
jgi:DNA-binding MarR family transcriptional regulator